MRLLTTHARVTFAALVALTALLQASCAVIGPASIQSGRRAYSDAISTTNDQQTLKTIVAVRYAESTSTLSVASVTASMRFAASSGFNVGIGPGEDYVGNLVPLSGGVAYEENPTISYIPVDGARYIREILSPIPLDLYLLLAATGESELVLRMLTVSVNHLRNPAFETESSAENLVRFERFLALLGELAAAKCVEWGREPESQELSMVFFGYAPDYTETVQELLEMLDLTMRADGGNITVPVYLGVGEPKRGSVAIKTRSIYDILRIAGAAIDAPKAHAETKLALDFPEVAAGSRVLEIKSARKRPAAAAVAMKHLDHWFYIDAADRGSRMAFQMLQLLVNVRLSGVGGGAQRAPVLTVPVGG
jgi:hypothetical protein